MRKLTTNFLFFFTFFSFSQEPLFQLLNSSDSGVDFINKLTETKDENIITYEYFFNGGGVAAGDFNNDGLIDLYFTSNQESDRIYLNKGNLKFDDITQKSGISSKQGWKTGVTLADVNDDGWLDIYVSYSGNFPKNQRKNKLYINQKNLTFKESASKYGIDDSGNTTQSVFFDYDKDGDLDLYVLNHNTKVMRNFDAQYAKKLIDENAGVRLYENLGNGKFTDVTLLAGISSNPIGYGLGIVISDFNNDNWDDIYISNDYVEEDYMYLNNQDGTFSNELKSQLKHISNFSMGVDAGDINNDGLSDIVTLDMLPEDNKRQKLIYAPDNFELYNNMVSNGFHHQSMRNMLQLNNGNNSFSEIGQLAGISSTDWSWSAIIADYNNDGYQDLYVSNGYYRDMINRDFMKFYVDERMKYLDGDSDENMFTILQEVESTPLQNYFFLNNKDLTFDNRTDKDGFNGEDFSHGAIYADLDNDGDLEIIVNCMNQEAKIFENKSIQNNSNNYFSIDLTQEKNKNSIGAKVLVYSGNEILRRDVQTSRGFQSSYLGPIHFGLGKKEIDSVKIIWPDQTYQNIKTNNLLNSKIKVTKNTTIKYEFDNKSKFFNVRYNKLNYKHEELLVNDFKVQPLLPYMISYHGPKIKMVDYNNDGYNDLFIGGPEGSSPVLFDQNKNGVFVKSDQPDFDNSSQFEDTNACFFDADNDGDLDLYIVSGGFAEKDSGLPLNDRLYINESGTYKLSSNIPIDNYVGSVAVPWDYDSDGDIDLFIGTRVKQAEFPKSDSSLILNNNGNGEFSLSDFDFLDKIGLVTDAQIEDIDGDGIQELIVVGDWNYPRIYKYINSDIIEFTSLFFEENLHGWWNTLEINDLDNDGDYDLVLGNWGTNNLFKPTVQEPMELYYDDFDKNGYIDPIWCYYIQGKSYPNVLREELTDQIVSLRKKFVTYEEYSTATLNDIFTKEQISKSPKLMTDFLETVWFENIDGKFKLKRFPVEANFSSVNSILIDDFDDDGIKDILMGGNSEYNRVRIGKCDSSFGIFLKGTDAGEFKFIENRLTDISFEGSVRSLNSYTSNGKKRIVVGLNNSYPLVLTLEDAD